MEKTFCPWLYWILLFTACSLRGRGQTPAVKGSSVPQEHLIARFYSEKAAGLFWYGPGEQSVALRSALRASIDSAGTEGLAVTAYMPDVLKLADSLVKTGQGEQRLADWDRCYTDAALALSRDLYEGAGIDSLISYDGVSRQYAARDEEYLVQGLLRVRTAVDLQKWLSGLLPTKPAYAVMRDSLALFLQSGGLPAQARTRSGRLATAMSLYRWVHHFGFDKMIVVNIPSAGLHYFSGDSLVLSMKVVAGQPSKRTPRFAAWCDGLVLYPYWNVPHKIAIKELLPLLRLAPGVAASMELEILDAKGRKIDPSNLSWASYTAANFPYEVRQAPGCLNALGVIKFDINTPFDVYLHDTNEKGAFRSVYRYYSHGCIRLERPIALGRALLADRLDTTYLLSCFKDQRPVPVKLSQPVAVFVLYSTVGLDASGKLDWYKDIYQLFDRN